MNSTKATIGILIILILKYSLGVENLFAQSNNKKVLKGYEKSASNNKYDVATYVWPAYFPDSRYKDIGVFPDGKGEWETVYNAKPKFQGHDQPRIPLWGYVNEADPKIMEKEIEAASTHDVNVFIFDWYWNDGQPFLEDQLNKGFLKASNSNKMSFYIMWANCDLTSYLDPVNPDKSKIYWKEDVDNSTFDKMTDHIINDYFKQPNYYKLFSSG